MYARYNLTFSNEYDNGDHNVRVIAQFELFQDARWYLLGNETAAKNSGFYTTWPDDMTLEVTVPGCLCTYTITEIK